MNATQELIKAAQILLDSASKSMEQETVIVTVYGYKLERCPDDLLKRYIELANKNIYKNKHKPDRLLEVQQYVGALGTVERELDARKALGITITHRKGD